MRSIVVFVTAVAVLGCYQLVLSQARRCRDASLQRTVSDIQERPQLGIEYSRVAQFKLASRKRSYRIGEMFSLDVAMLNTANAQVFFHKPSGPTLTINARDDKGAEITVTPTSMDLEAVIPQSYLLLDSNEVIVGSLQVLAGCNVEGVAAFDEARQKFNKEVHQGQVKYGKGLFERNLFINWGDACLRLTQPGTYTITVEITNQHVVVSSCESSLKTAVGNLISTPLTITVIE